MLALLTAALLVAAAAQSAPADRTRAEQLARAGHSAEALALFEKIAGENPADVDARLWVARLDLRLGRTEKAEAGFRSVVDEHPADGDARIGLATALTRRGAWQDALAILAPLQRDGNTNPDLFAALGGAYRRAGDNRQALDSFRRAKALAPDAPDIVDGFENAAEVYGHSLAVEGFGEDTGTSTARSLTVTAFVRTTPSIWIEGSARVKQQSDSSDVLGGGGVRWRVDRSTVVGVRALGGSGNVSLANRDVTTVAVRYVGDYELGGSVRFLSYSDASVVAVSAPVAWDRGRWRLDSRLTLSRTAFETVPQTSVDWSTMLRGTWRGWRRVSLNATYAYGIESFEDLTADRLSSLGAHTLAGGFSVSMPSLTRLYVTWEHQWRSNDARMDRVTLSLVQTFP